MTYQTFVLDNYEQAINCMDKLHHTLTQASSLKWWDIDSLIPLDKKFSF